jgi:hypothetical protein
MGIEEPRPHCRQTAFTAFNQPWHRDNAVDWRDCPRYPQPARRNGDAIRARSAGARCPSSYRWHDRWGACYGQRNGTTAERQGMTANSGRCKARAPQGEINSLSPLEFQQLSNAWVQARPVVAADRSAGADSRGAGRSEGRRISCLPRIL